MSLNTVTTGNTVLAADINQLVNVLQRASGQTEVGKYKVAGNGYTTNAAISCYVPSLSRGATPVSVTIDTANDAPTGNLGSPSTFNLTSSGFLVAATVSAASINAYCSGNYTIQY